MQKVVLNFREWIKEVGSRAEPRGTLVRAKAIATAVAIYNSMVCSEVRAEL